MTREQTESSFETLATRVLAVGRVASALWAFALFTAFRESFDGPIPGLLLSIAVLLSVVAAANAVRSVVDWRALCAVEVVVAAGLMFADGASSANGHLFSGAAGLGGPWPTVVVAAAGAAGGIAVGLAAGAAVGAARVAGVLASGEVVFAAQGQGLAGGVIGLVVVGLASGALLAALREAERRIASARAREAVARRLHDGVLQALAIVRRRSKDAELVALVADADRDLRAFLDRGDAEGELDLEGGLRQAVDECERRFGLAVVVVVDELPRRVSSDVSAAVIGALNEALANVSKHAGVTQATVFAGVDDENGFYVSVTDRGVGFDPGAFAPGRGLSGSVNGRMHEVGGSATVRPLKGGGTQVMLCLP
jgi:signal transduction histidine kinase